MCKSVYFVCTLLPMPTPKPRRARGTGSITRRKDGLYMVRFKGRTAYAKTQTEANKKLAKLITDNTPRTVDTRIKVSDYLDIWLKEKRQEIKPAVARTYEEKIRRYINPIIGHMRLNDVGALDVERVWKTMIDHGLSPASARYAFRVMSVAFKDAERLGTIIRNPCAAARTPKVPKNPMPAISAPVLAQIVEANKTEPYLTRFLLGIFTAGRQGEILGLELDRLHLNVPMPYVELTRSLQRVAWIHGCDTDAPCWAKRATDCPMRHLEDISPTYQPEQVHGSLVLMTPKTVTSARPIALMPPITQALHLWIEHTQPTRFVFERDSQPIDPSWDRREWKRLQQQAGLSTFYPVHSLRHTAATLMAEAGIDERIRIGVMGHSSADMTAHYTHRQVAEQHLALGALANLWEREVV